MSSRAGTACCCATSLSLPKEPSHVVSRPLSLRAAHTCPAVRRALLVGSREAQRARRDARDSRGALCRIARARRADRRVAARAGAQRRGGTRTGSLHLAHGLARDAVRAVRVFFRAEDGIRDLTVTGVQTCALPI